MEERGASLEAVVREICVCTRCDLHLTAQRAVPGEGPLDAQIMLVGEAPGASEDREGRPFVGASGRFLNELLAQAGLKREEVYITNVVKHRPPNNRPPERTELDACLPYLFRQIDIIQPRLIVTLGRFSLGTFFPGEVISRSHGQIREKDGRYFFAMYHPAAALHQKSLRDTLLRDMASLGKFLKGPFVQATPQPAIAPAPKSTENIASSDDPPEQLPLL